MAMHDLWAQKLAALVCALFLFGATPPARAEDDATESRASKSGSFPDVETKYIFGSFTRGAAVGELGERAIEPDIVANFGRRSGGYATAETELELEYTPTKFLQIEVGPTISYYNIHGVPGLYDRNSGGLNGVSGTIRSLLIEQGQWPFSATLTIEPSWRSLDETSGATVSSYALETKIEADAELIKNRLFYAFNLLYEPAGSVIGNIPSALGAGVDNWRFQRARISGDPKRRSRHRSVVPAPLRRDHTQFVHRRCSLSGSVRVLPPKPYSVAACNKKGLPKPPLPASRLTVEIIVRARTALLFALRLSEKNMTARGTIIDPRFLRRKGVG